MGVRRFPPVLTVGSLLFAGTCTLAAQSFPDFEVHVMGNWGKKLGQTSLVDVDQDGDLDWVVGRRDNDVRWFEYRAADDWVNHKLGGTARSDVGGTAFDIDGDGWVDHAAGGTWYRNTGSPRTEEFTRYTNGAQRTHDNVAADIDGDGDLDLVAMNDNGIWWYEIPADPTDNWIETWIGNAVHGAFDPRGVADLDGDGDVDIVRSTGWFRNNGDGTAWTWQGGLDGGSGGRYPDTTKSWIVDFDGDGDADVVMSSADSETDTGWVRWFENNNGVATNWTRHDVTSGRGDLHSLAVFDFDGDGDFDIFTGEGPLGGTGPGGDRLTWIFEQDGSNWIPHQLSSGYRCHEAMAGDVDGDGDIDICFKPWNGSTHVYLENKLYDGGSGPIVPPGWHPAPGNHHGDGAGWRLENGIIIGEQSPAGSGNGGVLVTDEVYGDVELNLEMWTDWNQDSGIFFRASDDADQAYQVTVDMQNNSSVGGIYGEGIGGFKVWDFSFDGNETTIKGNPGSFALDDWDGTVWHAGTWNAIRATCVGNPPVITVWINGYQTVQYDGSQHGNKLPATGRIGLQVHNGNQWPSGNLIRFRNISITPYAVTEPPVISEVRAASTTVPGTSVQLLVTATDLDSTALDYLWTVTDQPSGASVTIPAGEDPIVEFDQAGTYNFRVTVTDESGNTDWRAVDGIVVEQTATSIAVSP